MSVAKHTSYNLIGVIVPSLVSLVTVPLYLHAVGLERYGVLSICWLVLGYFGVFDLGLGRAVSQRLAALGAQEGGEASDTFWAGLLVSLVIGAAGTLLLIPVAHFALSFIRFENTGVAAELPAAIPWLAATLPVTLVTGIFSGALVGRQRFGALNILEGFANSATLIVPLLCAWLFGADLWHLIAASLLSRLVFAALMFALCRTAVPLSRPKRPPPGLVRSLLGYGGWVSVSGIVGPIMALWDRFAVGAWIGAGAVSAYVIPFMLVTRLILLPAALARALFPRLAGADDETARSLSRESTLALSAVMTLLSLLVIAATQPFMTVWLGADLAGISSRVAWLFLPGVWMNGLAQIAFTTLHARGRPDIAAKIHLAEIIPYLATLYGGMYLFGLEGAALAWSLRCAADAVLMFRYSVTGLEPIRTVIWPTLLICGAAAIALTSQRLPVLQFGLLSLCVLAGIVHAIRTMPRSVRLPLPWPFRNWLAAR